MNVKVKSKETLIEEGWIENKRSINHYLTMDGSGPRHSKGPMSISKLMAQTFLGQEVEVVNSERDYDKEITISIKHPLFGVRKVSPFILDCDVKKLLPRKKARLANAVKGEDMVWDGILFRVGCRTITENEAVLVAKWILKQVSP